MCAGVREAVGFGSMDGKVSTLKKILCKSNYL